MDKERSAFSFELTDEQVQYVEELVDYSIKHHPVKDKYPKKHQYDYRWTGTAGEVAFSDAYGKPRPERSFGAIDGQDMGVDFTLGGKNFDIKSQKRGSEILYDNYVFNIPAYQLEKKESETDYYCHISVSPENGKWRAAVVGYVEKNKILTGQIGQRYQTGTMRERADKTGFAFDDDTYEVPFHALKLPIITERIKQLPGFRLINIKKSKKYENKGS